MLYLIATLNKFALFMSTKLDDGQQTINDVSELIAQGFNWSNSSSQCLHYEKKEIVLNNVFIDYEIKRYQKNE